MSARVKIVSDVVNVSYELTDFTLVIGSIIEVYCLVL